MDAAALASPALYPLSFAPDTDRVQLVPLDEAGYRASSFLDQRILDKTGPGDWAPWTEAAKAAAPLTGECDFIFHTGHVGSTLLSRLLGHSPRVFSLREPAVLRALAGFELGGEARLDDWTATFLKLWGRTWRPEQKTLLKATSFASELAPLLMRLNPSAQAILMFVSPSIYLAGILSGAASREELIVNAPARLARLHRRLGRPVWRLEALSEGEAAAMSWLCEVLALARAAAAFPGRVLWFDFQAFLAQPQRGLFAALQRLHGQADPFETAMIAQSPDMGRYSKAQEYAYDPGLRQRVLQQAAAEHAAEIAKGVAWLNAAGGAHPVLAQAMTAAGAAARAGFG